MEEFLPIFEGVERPRRSIAARHDLVEMLTIGLLSTLCGGHPSLKRLTWVRAMREPCRSYPQAAQLRRPRPASGRRGRNTLAALDSAAGFVLD